jgi:hypothetical protein
MRLSTGEGEGPALIPIDPQIAEEIVEKGDGFLVESTVRDLEQHLERSMEWPSIERSIDRTLGRDGPPDDGGETPGRR